MSDKVFIVEHWENQKTWVPIPNTARLTEAAARRATPKRDGVWYRVRPYERARKGVGLEGGDGEQTNNRRSVQSIDAC